MRSQVAMQRVNCCISSSSCMSVCVSVLVSHLASFYSYICAIQYFLSCLVTLIILIRDADRPAGKFVGLGVHCALCGYFIVDCGKVVGNNCGQALPAWKRLFATFVIYGAIYSSFPILTEQLLSIFWRIKCLYFYRFLIKMLPSERNTS